MLATTICMTETYSKNLADVTSGPMIPLLIKICNPKYIGKFHKYIPKDILPSHTKNLVEHNLLSPLQSYNNRIISGNTKNAKIFDHSIASCSFRK